MPAHFVPAGRQTARPELPSKKSSTRYQTFTEWTVTIAELRAGEFPSMKLLAGALLGDSPVPREVRDFLVNLADSGKMVGPKAGRPNQRDLIQRTFDADFVHAEYRFQHERALADKAMGKTLAHTPRTTAILHTADELDGYSGDNGCTVWDAGYDWVKTELRKPHWTK